MKRNGAFADDPGNVTKHQLELTKRNPGSATGD
jgi:hypothetical protein